MKNETIEKRLKTILDNGGYYTIEFDIDSCRAIIKLNDVDDIKIIDMGRQKIVDFMYRGNNFISFTYYDNSANFIKKLFITEWQAKEYLINQMKKYIEKNEKTVMKLKEHSIYK